MTHTKDEAFLEWYDNAHWGNEDFKEGCKRAWNAAIKQALAASTVSEGWKLVPIKLTPEMLAVCDEDVGSKIIDGPAYAEAVWMCFLTAAPEK